MPEGEGDARRPCVTCCSKGRGGGRRKRREGGWDIPGPCASSVTWPARLLEVSEGGGFDVEGPEARVTPL